MKTYTRREANQGISRILNEIDRSHEPVRIAGARGNGGGYLIIPAPETPWEQAVASGEARPAQADILSLRREPYGGDINATLAELRREDE